MRKLAWFAGSFALGVFLAVYLLPEGVWLPVGAGCALAGLSGLLARDERRLRVLLVGFGLACGLIWTGTYAAVVHAPARALAGTEGAVAATVLDWPQNTARGSSVLVGLHLVEGAPVKTLLYLEEGAPDLRPGDEVSFYAGFRRADILAGTQSDYYYAKGILLLAYADGAPEIRRPEVPPLRVWPAYLAKSIKDSIARSVPADAAPLITALVTGDKSGLPGGVYAAFQRSGLAHVVAVSGLHVSFLAGLITALLGPNRRRSALVGMGLMALFAAVAGNTPSVLRAAFMQSMLLVAPLLGREDDRPTSLCAILMLLLLQNPYAAASVSLQLSFAAVAGIYLFTGPLCARWQAWLPAKPSGFWPRVGCLAIRFLSASLAVTLGALAFTTPLSAYYFRSVSLIAPVTNLLALWAVSDVFMGGLAVALLALVLPGAAGVLALPVCLPARYLLWVTEKLAGLPFAAVSTQPLCLRLWLGLVYAMLLLYLLGKGEKRRALIPLGLGTVTLCAALLVQAAPQAGRGITVSVLDVGQGLSVALTSQGHTALVDCGGTGADNPDDTVVNYFQSMGLSRIDLVVLTHYHADHAGGIPALLERMEVGLLVLPDVEQEAPLRSEIMTLAEEKGIETLLIGADTDVRFGGAELRVYAPLGSGGGNEEGLSVLCTAGTFDALITGDMNAAVERRLIKYGDLPDLELLVAGHHGSQYSTSEELLLAGRPELAVISVGYNTYGHPAPETLERLAAAGCEIYRTDWFGTVTITAAA